MADRFQHRQNYIDGWYELDADKLEASVTEDFFFDDPAMPQLINKASLRQYMHDWDSRVTAAGGTGEWELSDVVNIDDGGILYVLGVVESAGYGFRRSSGGEDNRQGCHLRAYRLPRQEFT